MTIQDVNMGDYDEVDRRYNEKLVEIYRYMVHVKPYVVKALCESSDPNRCAQVASIYANLCMTFGEFRSMTIAQMPNLAFKRKFFEDTLNRFDGLLVEYRRLISGDSLVLTEAEQKIVL